MIALNPQFAALLVTLTASTVGAVPNPHVDGRTRRYVVGAEADLDVIANADLQSGAAGILDRRQEHDHGKRNTAVYIMAPASVDLSSGKRAVSAKSAMRKVKRGLNDPIDQPDTEEQIHAEEADLPYGDSYDGSYRKRENFRVRSQLDLGLFIARADAHVFHQVSHALALREFERRGLLDPLMPILGSIPGVGGIVQLVGGLLSDVLGGLPIVGPVLGDLILSPHPSASAQSAGNDTEPASEFFLDASSSTNGSTIYVVDSGHPTSFAIASQSNGTNTTSEHIVSLQMAFVNATSGQMEPYCATFDNSASGQSALAVKPCITDGMSTPPDASQSFGWNPANKAIRPMWNNESGNKKRDYVVQAGTSQVKVEENGDSKSVVLLFEPFSAPAPTNGTTAVSAASSPDEAVEAESENGDDEDSDSEGDSVPVYVAGVQAS